MPLGRRFRAEAVKEARALADAAEGSAVMWPQPENIALPWMQQPMRQPAPMQQPGQGRIEWENVHPMVPQPPGFAGIPLDGWPGLGDDPGMVAMENRNRQLEQAQWHRPLPIHDLHLHSQMWGLQPVPDDVYRQMVQQQEQVNKQREAARQQLEHIRQSHQRREVAAQQHMQQNIQQNMAMQLQLQQQQQRQAHEQLQLQMEQQQPAPMFPGIADPGQPQWPNEQQAQHHFWEL